MARYAGYFAPGEFYHVYNRGVEKRNIFLNEKDRARFLALLYLSNSDRAIHLSNHQGLTLPELLALPRGEPLVDICAYCLMPNHVHLLLREKSEGGISSFMQKLTTGYTMYFNTYRERSGALFQGTYKAEHAADDRYLKYLISYIHLNPIKLIEPAWKETGIKNRTRARVYLENYRHSSFPDYGGADRPQKKILDRAALPDYFETPDIFKTSVTEWLSYDSSDNHANGKV